MAIGNVNNKFFTSYKIRPPPAFKQHKSLKIPWSCESVTETDYIFSVNASSQDAKEYAEI